MGRQIAYGALLLLAHVIGFLLAQLSLSRGLPGWQDLHKEYRKLIEENRQLSTRIIELEGRLAVTVRQYDELSATLSKDDA